MKKTIKLTAIILSLIIAFSSIPLINAAEDGTKVLWSNSFETPEEQGKWSFSDLDEDELNNRHGWEFKSSDDGSVYNAYDGKYSLYSESETPFGKKLEPDNLAISSKIEIKNPDMQSVRISWYVASVSSVKFAEKYSVYVFPGNADDEYIKNAIINNTVDNKYISEEELTEKTYGYYNHTFNISDIIKSDEYKDSIRIVFYHHTEESQRGLKIDAVTVEAFHNFKEVNSYTFENDMEGWKSISADSDGEGWEQKTVQSGSGFAGQNSKGCVVSASYSDSNDKPLNPINYLISPEITVSENSILLLKWYIGAYNNIFFTENYSVFVYRGSLEDFENKDLKNVSNLTSDNNIIKIVDNEKLEQPSGENEFTLRTELFDNAHSGKIRIIFVHHDCEGQYYIKLDNVSLSAVKKAEYTATFMVDGKTYGDPVKGTAGTKIEAPAAPTKDGYTFVGWALEGTTEILTFPQTMGSANVTYVAIFEEVAKFTATFKADGKVYGDVLSYATGEAIVAPAESPIKDGYVFKGWKGYTPGMKMGTTNVEFVAEWDVATVQYRLEIHEMGTDGEYPEIPAKTIIFKDGVAGETRTIDYTAPEGFEFSTDKKSVLEGTIAADGSTVFEVYLDRNNYTVTWVVPGQGDQVDTVAYGTAITAPANPTKTGYTFAGWDKTIPATMPAENVTITAKWTINQYTITFNTDGGNEIAPITQDYNTAVAAPANPTKTGYTFAGWDKGIPATMPAENMTITASWTINKYNITWEIDGETYKTDENVEYGAAITAPVPTKTGYVFSGWAEQIPATMPDGPLTFTGSWNPAADTKYTVNIHTMDAEGNYVTATDVLEGTTDSTVYAQYTVAEGFELGANSVTSGDVKADGTLVLDVYLNRKIYTITFENTGDSEIADISGLYGAAVAAPAAPTKEGYTFGGWDKEIPGTIPAENVTITASWNINTYTVNFLDADDGVFESFTLEYNAEIAAPANEPAKAHYTFEGWSLTKITEILNPEDLVNVALIDFENAAPTVPVDGLTIYPVFVRVPVALAIAEGSTANIVESEDNGTMVVGYIDGLETRLSEDVLRDSYITVEGDGRIEVTLTYFDICGTGTEVKVIDNVTDEVVGVYYLVIYGDVNGDADIDATDVAMIKDEALGITAWSSEGNTRALEEGGYDRSKVLAADMNGDGKILSADATILTNVTLFLAEIDQQSGEVIAY